MRGYDERIDIETEAVKNLDDALDKIKNSSDKDKRIIICGSLYLADWVLENKIISR